MTWFETPLSPDQRDVVGLVDAVIGKYGPGPEDDSPGGVAELRQALVEAGLWTLGADEQSGGGGAPFDLVSAALIALGAQWTAHAWGSAQAHAAAQLLTGQDAATELLREIHQGVPVCVVDTRSPHVELVVEAERITGTLWRLDPVGENPYVIALDGESTAWILPPGSLTPSPTRRRTGLAGAMTIAAEVDAPMPTALTGVQVAAVLARLRLAGAAIAAGIAVEAARRSLEYSRTRVQFGNPLTALPTVRQSLFAQAAQATEAVALALTTEPTVLRSASVLADNCERAVSVAAAAIQSHGGYGYLAEYGIERLLRDAISLRAATDPGYGVESAAMALAVAGTSPRSL